MKTRLQELKNEINKMHQKEGIMRAKLEQYKFQKAVEQNESNRNKEKKKR
jgi:hypothetical protein